MLFLFKSDNSADLLWNVEGASGTLHIPNVHKFLNHLEIARICFDKAQQKEREGDGTCDHWYDSYCPNCGLAAQDEDDRWINAAEANRV